MKMTYHFNSAQDIGEDFLEEIKANFKDQNIKITVKEAIDDSENEDQSPEDVSKYVSEDESINQLNKKFGI
jgi:hypothetical protein